MIIFKIVAIAIVTTATVLIVKETQKALAYVIALAGVCVACILILPQISEIISFVSAFATTGGISGEYLDVLLKSTGICIIVAFMRSILIDNGQSALAFSVELGGKVAVIIISLPIISRLFEVLLKII